MRTSLQLPGPPKLFGRDRQLEELDDAWINGLHVVSIVAWGGVGKTALVHTWRNRLSTRTDCPELLFEWSFASQGTRDRGAVPVDDFLRAALRFFGDVKFAESGATSIEKATRLAAVVGQRRALLVLDGLEPLQDPPHSLGASCPLREPSIAHLLRSLAFDSRSLCIITTREPIQDLEGFNYDHIRLLDLGHLDLEDGAELLQSLLVDGPRPRPILSTLKERTDISKTVRGHALTLQLLGIYIRRALGDIRHWQEIDFQAADELYGRHAFRVMDAYVKWLSTPGTPTGSPSSHTSTQGQRQIAALRLLGFFDRSADPGCIAALRDKPAIPSVTEALDGLDTHGWNALTASLEELRLVTRSEHMPAPVRGYDEAAAQKAGEEAAPTGPLVEHRPHDHGPDAMVLDAHPLIREYFARELRRTQDAGWREGHRRLYEHLHNSVPHWPEGIAGLKPLYQAVVHGCAAGRTADAYLNVYWARIQRGARAYGTHYLGAVSTNLAALACFFEHTWDTPSTALDAADQSRVLSKAARTLRALGRARDALGPMRAGLDRDVQLEHWKTAAGSAGNLSELELTLGQTSAAIDAATKSVEYADLIELPFQRIVMRATLADARHQAGDFAAARALFAEAEAIQVQYYPAEPQLYSLRGHRYCEFLLRAAERAAWHAVSSDPVRTADDVNDCQTVVDRASRSLRRAKWLLSIALDHLTLGRAALYAALLLAHTPACTAPSPALSFTVARIHLDAAVDGLRKACKLTFLPGALITRARLLHHTDPNLVLRDFDEAQTIADRGPMPLFQADIHLTRARLLHDHSRLARARELIERHGYGRRLDELAEAEAESLSWPAPEPPPPPVPPLPPRSSPMSTPPSQPSASSVLSPRMYVQRYDVAVQTIIGPELAAILAALRIPNDNRFFVNGGSFWPGEIESTLTRRKFSVIVHCQGEAGTQAASAAATTLLHLFNPRFMVLSGIAAGLRGKLKIGDVAIPRAVADLTQRVAEGGQMGRRPIISRLPYPVKQLLGSFDPARSGFVERFRSLHGPSPKPPLGSEDKHGDIAGDPAVREAAIASQDVLLRDPSVLADLADDLHQQIRIGEMEAAGFVVACERRHPSVPWLVVRGVSDFGDEFKSDDFHRMASISAAAYVAVFLERGLDLAAFGEPPEPTPPAEDVQADTAIPPTQQAARPAPQTPQTGRSAAPNPAPFAQALRNWQDKLAFLLEQEPTTHDHNAKHSLQQSIKEARDKIRELGGSA